MVAVPFVNETLAGHPAWSESLTRLREAGVRILDPNPDAPGAIQSGTGTKVADDFDPRRIVTELE
jgi:hypothetical protein